jgi:hypothetical protein
VAHAGKSQRMRLGHDLRAATPLVHSSRSNNDRRGTQRDASAPPQSRSWPDDRID